MKKIDKDGLLLCNIQGSLFEQSLNKTKTSSEIFIRRFMYSEISKEFDNLSFLDSTKTNSNIYEEIEIEYGVSDYGKTRYNKEELFWIGYIYRFFCYTYNLSSKQVYKIIKPKELRILYLPYHTMDCALAIERILEEKGYSFSEEIILKRTLEVYKKIRKNK